MKNQNTILVILGVLVVGAIFIYVANNKPKQDEQNNQQVINSTGNQEITSITADLKVYDKNNNEVNTSGEYKQITITENDPKRGRAFSDLKKDELGTTKKITYSSEPIVGAYVENKIQEIALEPLTKVGIIPTIGQNIVIQGKNAKVLQISGDSVTIDTNIDYASQQFTYEFTIIGKN